MEMKGLAAPFFCLQFLWGQGGGSLFSLCTGPPPLLLQLDLTSIPLGPPQKQPKVEGMVLYEMQSTPPTVNGSADGPSPEKMPQLKLEGTMFLFS